ncbi:hypothetical protein [Actinomadura verrucosospora]|uniref:Uncharacterized protein n=1 Tax=Actinomadura verrucosospora TaxID=46165 RepID=A0A7D3ZGU3_ACTVE|nr:hypothetical protein [Actinomadura verrucosospora]QKG19061.1 hypothetical protein ACTIVE_0697 [Actinomadura verrucosospora]
MTPPAPEPPEEPADEPLEETPGLPPAGPHAARTVPLVRGGPARRAAEPLAWWAALFALYLSLISTIDIIEITVGAVVAAFGAAAATAGRRALFTTGTAHDPAGTRRPAADLAPGARPVPPARLLPPLALLPGQIVADSARVAVLGASGGTWTPLAVAPGAANRGTATLLVSTSPATFVGAVDPERGLLHVHRLGRGPSAFERRLRGTGLVREAR